MILSVFQGGKDSMGGYMALVLMGSLLLAAFILLKLGLSIVKAEKRTRIKWVGYSFLIQFGVVFAIGSPLMLLGFAGAYDGDPGPIILVVVVASFVDLNVINVIHQVGLKRSLAVLALILVPIVFSMRFLGEFLANLQYM